MSRKTLERRKVARRKARQRSIVWGSAAIGLVVLVGAAFAMRSPISVRPDPETLPVEPKIGARAPDFSLPDTAGQEVSLSDFRGQPVAMMFFHSW